MSEWISMMEKKPSRRMLCDFVTSGDGGEPLIWMLCRAQLSDWEGYEHTGVQYWREAQQLPADVGEYE